MFKNNVTLPQIVRSATDLHPALPAVATLRMRSENGATNRGDSLFGEMTIKHSPTKELGGGYRHVIRVDLREQGDIKPAFAYLVIGNHDSVAGEGRAKEAVNALFSALFSLNDTVDVEFADVSTGVATSYIAGEDTGKTLNDLVGDSAWSYTNVLNRLLARES